MVGQVQDRRLVRRCTQVEGQTIVVVPSVLCDRRECSRITFFSIRADIRELQTYRGVGLDLGDLPHPFVKTDLSTVEMIRSVVGRQTVGFTLERELALGDSIAKAAHGCPKVRVPLKVTVDAAESCGHVGFLAVLVGHLDRNDDRAVIDQLDDVPCIIGQLE